MTYHIDIQNACTTEVPVNDQEIVNLVTRALRDHQPDAELTIRLVDEEEMIFLNSTYRKQNKTTNVLAFPSVLPEGVALECPLLGDVIICPQVLLAESLQLNKSIQEHWALIIIHGVLHLLGYDHINDDDALIMQAIEVKLLAEMSYANPYDTEGNQIE